VVQLANQELGDLAGKSITMLGISFKPDSDDLRDSPALEIAQRLTALGAKVTVHDPVSLTPLATRSPELSREENLIEAARGSELLILGTEWKLYREVDPQELAAVVMVKTIIDGRNVLDVAKWQRAGWRVIALGRNVHRG
jgi:UDPglucose 6-dehydrogenase